MLNIVDANKKFIKKLEDENKSNSTVIAYKKDIEQLIEYLNSCNVYAVEEINIDHLKGFMKDLEDKNYTLKSISRKTNATRTFIKYLYVENIIPENIGDKLKHPKFDSKNPRILSRLEYRALRDAAREDIRSYTMIEALIQTGITISELAEMKVEDLDLKEDKGTLYIPKRNNKESRNIPLNKAITEALNKYIKQRPNLNSEYVFITKSGNHLLVRNIRSTIDRFFKIAGVEKAKVNDLRHTFVAHHLSQGVSILQLSKIAGHKRISTTEKYLEYIEKPTESTKTDLGIL